MTGHDPHLDVEERFDAEDIMSVYARYADRIDRFAWVDRLITGRYRRRAFAAADGDVLDVACGTGTNVRYLPPVDSYVGIDVSPHMLSYAREAVRSAEVDGDVHRMDATTLAFPDDRFDTVISSLSTCTIPDPVEAVREMARVCRPGGRILLLEHGRSDRRPIAWLQSLLAERKYARTGCRSTQEPLRHLEAASIPVESVRTAIFGIVTIVAARPE